MNARITILSDNHAAPGLEAEHGFALWIERNDFRLLFDTGEGRAFWHNIATLGCDIAQTDAVVLSHGHSDHTGNLSAIIEKAPGATLYSHPASDMTRYSLHESARSIGMPLECAVTMAAMRLNKRRAVLKPIPVAPGMWLSGPIARQTEFEDSGGPFYKDNQGKEPDNIDDDLALWFETPAGLVVCLGCGHAGVINTLRHVIEASGESRIALLLGGTHLVNADRQRLDRTASALAEFDIPRVVLCHCTGEASTQFLKERLGSSAEQGYAGLVIEI